MSDPEQPERNESAMPEPGDPAPEFSGPTQRGETLSLETFAGRRLALYFYPKDDTPGCTKQACSLRDGWDRLEKAGIAVVGVSHDAIEDHEAFAEKYDLPFPLIADPDHAILEAYGVWGERNMFGNTFVGTTRTTFLIDGEGLVRDVIRRPDTENHAAEILERWESLDSAPTTA